MKELNIDIDSLLVESAEHYHSQAKENLSSHQVMDFIKCPLLYFQKKTGKIKDKDTSSYLMGRAVHARVLEGKEEFEKQFELNWPMNPDTGEPYGGRTKIVKEWKAGLSKPVLNPSDVIEVAAIASGVGRNEFAVELLSNGKPERVARTSYEGMPCQIRMDWINPQRGIIDLKTVTDLDKFQFDARKYGYHHQAVFYLKVMYVITGKLLPFYVIAVEKAEPYRCGVWQFSNATLATAERQVNKAIARIKECQLAGFWPTNYEQVRILDF
jgi:hypothetical protein